MYELYANEEGKNGARFLKMRVHSMQNIHHSSQRNLLWEEWSARGLPPGLFEVLLKSVDFSKPRHGAPERNHLPSEHIEIEAKFRISDDLVGALRCNGCTRAQCNFEQNEMYDCGGTLLALDSRLRIRTMVDLMTESTTGLLTVKQPMPRSGDGLKREFELEDDLNEEQIRALKSRLADAGYVLTSGYERVRHKITVPGHDVDLVVDLLPDIGRFIEIEGDADQITRFASKLGLDIKTAIEDPYDTLHADWCLSRGEPELAAVRFPSSTLKAILLAEKALF